MVHLFPNLRRLQRTAKVLSLAGILAAIAMTGILSGCSSSPPTPTPEPVTPLSAAQRDEAILNLNQTLIVNSLAQLRPNEPSALCSKFEQANWDIDRVVDPLLEAAGNNAEAWRDFHNHATLPVVLMGLMEQQGMGVAEQAAGVQEWLRAFCGSL